MARAKYGWRIAGLIFKAICTAFIIGIFALIAWRIIDSKTTPKEIRHIIPNEILCEAYEQNGGKLTIFTQDQEPFTRVEGKNYGYFHIGDAIFIDEADQIQFTLKYNNSTIERLVIDHSLPMLPARSEDLYDVSVVVMYDLTPDNAEDNYGDVEDAVSYERFFPGECISSQKTLYNYRKFVFDGIDVTKRVLAIYVDIYYKGAVNYDEDAYGTILIYDYKTENEAYKLTLGDKNAIKSFEK